MTAAMPAAYQILELLGVTAVGPDTTVHVKAPGQMFGLTIERALFRIEEFKEDDQGMLMTMLPFIWSMPGFRVMYVTAQERQLVNNFRVMDKEYRISMAELIEDLAEKSVAPLAWPQY